MHMKLVIDNPKPYAEFEDGNGLSNPFMIPMLKRLSLGNAIGSLLFGGS